MRPMNPQESQPSIRPALIRAALGRSAYDLLLAQEMNIRAAEQNAQQGMELAKLKESAKDTADGNHSV